MTFKLHEFINRDLHTLTATGDKGSGKTFLLDMIADGCAAWGFRVKVRSFFDENLVLVATRRAPRRVLPLVEQSLPAWGFARARTANQPSASVLPVQRRDPPELAHGKTRSEHGGSSA